MGKGVRREEIYSKSTEIAMAPYIDPGARGTLYIILYAYHIYTAIRHQIPLPGYKVLDLGSRVSMVSRPNTSYQAHTFGFLALALTMTPFSK